MLLLLPSQQLGYTLAHGNVEEKNHNEGVGSACGTKRHLAHGLGSCTEGMNNILPIDIPLIGVLMKEVETSV